MFRPSAMTPHRQRCNRKPPRGHGGYVRCPADAGIAREDLYLAWDFNIASVENITERILHIRDDAFAALGNAAPGIRRLR